MFIQTEQTPNPQTLKFIPGEPVLTNGTAEFLDSDSARKGSPLAERLFGIEGVKSVFFGSDFVAITKSDGAKWEDLRTYILGVLFEQFSLQKPILYDVQISENDVEDDEITRKIKSILDERVRPAVARDGGDIVFKKFDKGIVWLTMRGACAGCPSSTMTLKMGIENMLRHFIPEVLEVRAAED